LRIKEEYRNFYKLHEHIRMQKTRFISLKKTIFKFNILLYGCLLSILFLSPSRIFAQETVVVGQVLNSSDRSPISGVNIYFKNSEKVVQSNEEGFFSIQTTGNYNKLLFSCVGFKQAQIHVKPGQSIGIEVLMTEENTLLGEVFVLPGSNPGMEFIRKVRLLAKTNDITRRNGYTALSTEQNLVLLSKINKRTVNKRIFEQLKKGNISPTDSTLVLPIYMAETNYQLTNISKKELSKNIFSSSENGQKIIEKLIGDIDTKLNFYHNTVSIYGKTIISPLSIIGSAYYDYYLADSIYAATGKQYEIHFRTKNVKNLAFDGKLWVDSASLALTKIEAELPNKANINFIHNLRIAESFSHLTNNNWVYESEQMTMTLNYALLGDSLNSNPEIFIKRTTNYLPSDTINQPNINFAQSTYTQESLNDKLKSLNNTPLLRTASWVADVFFTGYVPVGIIDIGRIPEIMRTTEIEGYRLTLPFRTNEKLWKNVSIGGHIGYGFENEIVKYSGMAQFKLPGKKRRVLSLNYTNDYRRIDYNYNDVLYRENPLVTGDEDMSGTVLANRVAGKMSNREEYCVSFANDWNSTIESNLYLRSNILAANEDMPMSLNGTSVGISLKHQSATLTTRFSFDEKKYNDHTQRVYIANDKPVIYSILEYGKYNLGSKSGQYGKVLAKMRQDVKFGLGELYYIAEAGFMLGSVPYPLLEIPQGGDTGGYGIYQFNLMNDLEYATDKYVDLHCDFTFNGLILNQIPIIKSLNLREMCSFNIAYGGLSNSHKAIIDYPFYTNPLSKPYMEVGVGLANIFKVLTVQSIWRLTDLNHVGVVPHGIKACLRLSL